MKFRYLALVLLLQLPLLFADESSLVSKGSKECGELTLKDMRVKVFPGVGLFSLHINQYDNIRPFVVSVSNKHLGFKLEQEIIEPVVNKEKFSSQRLKMTGLQPDTKYEIKVKVLCEDAHEKVIHKRTLTSCEKRCINGDCIRKWGHEACLCQSGFYPSEFEKEWGFTTCFPNNGTCIVNSNDLCSKHAHCDVTIPQSKCVCDEGYGFNREPTKNCRRKFSRECVPCHKLAKSYLQIHAYPGITSLLIEVKQVWKMKPFKITIRGSDYVVVKDQIMYKNSTSKVSRNQVLFTGLMPGTQYRINVEVIAHCSYNKTIKKKTLTHCSRPCTNGMCIRKTRGERCRCHHGFVPSPHQSSRTYNVCFPKSLSCKSSSSSDESLCPDNSKCLLNSEGQYRCQCDTGFVFDGNEKVCQTTPPSYDEYEDYGAE